MNEVLRKGIKKRRESIEMYDKAARADLADRSAPRSTALEAYLPANVSDDEIRAAIRKVIAEGATNIGGVMGKVKPHVQGTRRKERRISTDRERGVEQHPVRAHPAVHGVRHE